VLIQVQGSLTTPDIALGGLLWTHSWSQRHRAMRPETDARRLSRRGVGLVSRASFGS
jgi:hypothetical protein